MVIDPSELDRLTRSGLMNGLVMPRPIAWVSSIAPDGSRNLAPFSFFGAFSFDPPTIGIGPGTRQGIAKDTLRNVRASGEMVINLVDRRLAVIANACSAEFGSDIDEWEVSGLEGAESETVAPMRIAIAPVSLECRVREVIELGGAETASNNLVVAWITRIHVRDDAMDGMVPNSVALDLVGRLGGEWWCTTRDRFALPRPASRDPQEVRAEMFARLEELDA